MDLLKKIVWPIKILGAGIIFIMHALLGSFSWNPPAWLRYLNGKTHSLNLWARANLLKAAALSVVLLLLIGGLSGGTYWYKHRPKPLEVGVKITAPELTKLEDDKRKVFPCVITFLKSAAPLGMIGKTVSQGIRISPEIEGTWSWTNDHELRFMPKPDWPVGQEYTVSLAKKGLVADHVRLAQYDIKFNTAPFSTTITQSEYYQDPADPNLKKTVATVTFSHPVDAVEFEKRVSMRMVTDKDGVPGEPKNYGFKVTYDKLKLNAYVHSEPIAIPERDSVVHVVVDAGVRAAAGGPPSAGKVEKPVNIPSLYSYLAIDSTELSLVKNDRSEPEQVMILTTSAPIHEKEIQKSVGAFLLPVFHPDSKQENRKMPYNWNDPSIRSFHLCQRA
jgi:hypothetical protein